MKKSLVVSAALVAVGLCTPASQAENRAGTVAITPFVGGYTFDGVQRLEPSMLYGLRAGYNITRAAGVEGVFETAPNIEGRSDNSSAKLLNYRMEALYHLFPENRFVPFLAAGYGGTRLSFHDNNALHANETRYAGVISYGLGAKYFLNDNVALRADARQMVIYRGPVNYNYEYTVGASFIFGGSKTAPIATSALKPDEPVVISTATPLPTCSLTVSPATIVKGNAATLNWVSANTNECSVTPVVGSVQTNGSMSVTPAESTLYSLSCSGAGGATATSQASLAVTMPISSVASPPVDSDRDGVADTLDKCPDTPSGSQVDKNGCTPVSACKSEKLDIYFDTDKSLIKTKYHESLKLFAAKLKSYPKATVVVEGHTDSVASENYNMRLSLRRADAVLKHIMNQQGIAVERLTTKGFGEANPLYSNDTAASRSKNRRVDTFFNCPQ